MRINISVLDQNGMESIGTLSKGESHFLALSFVNALHLVSGFKTPIVIDTPLGRISGEPKLNLAKVLPKFTESKQLILLVTDQEYTPEVRGALKKSIGKEFKIKFVETDIGCKAEVIPYEEKT
jgi:DNA sulfur modification protein DndD